MTVPPAKLGAPAFYKKYTEASGYPIVASGTVNDYALREAAYLTDMMLAKIPKVRDAMIESGSRLCILAWNEFTTDLPEFAHFKPKDFWDARARGTGGSETDTAVLSTLDDFAVEDRAEHQIPHRIGRQQTHGLAGGQIPKRFVTGGNVEQVDIADADGREPLTWGNLPNLCQNIAQNRGAEHACPDDGDGVQGCLFDGNRCQRQNGFRCYERCSCKRHGPYSGATELAARDTTENPGARRF
jgi:hypothetical protein